MANADVDTPAGQEALLQMMPPLVQIPARPKDVITQEIEMARESVEVRFDTRADLLEARGELDDADWIALGHFVADLAREQRRLRRSTAQ